MTIKEFADSRGVTPQAIYKRLKANGVHVSNILNTAHVDDRQQYITKAGMNFLNVLYPMETPYITVVEEYPRRDERDERVSALEQDNEHLRAENARMHAEIEALRTSEASARQTAERMTKILTEALIASASMSLSVSKDH